jgi:alpha-2-macroglobulin
LPVSVTFTPDKAGTYEVRAHSLDINGNYLEAGFATYVLGADYVPWFADDSQPQLTLLADKEFYKPGDTARVLVQSPFQKATGLLTLERNGVMQHSRFEVTSSATSLQIPITDEFTPNVYASVTLYKGRTGAPSAKDPSDPNRPQVITGTLNLNVPPKTKELSVHVATDKREYFPGSDASATVKVVDAKGQPAKGEVTVWAVDEGVLRLTNYSEPDLLQMMYPGRVLAVDTADSRMRLVARNPDDKGGTDGQGSVAPGGGGGESSVTDGIRTDFRTLAAWSATVKVGDDGNAVVQMKLPESLTEYRVIAVATSGADRFGTGRSSLTVRKKFQALAALPRSVNVGDSFEAGAVLRNETGTSGPATLTIDIPADSSLVVEGPKTLTVPSLAGVPIELRFRFKAVRTGPASFNLKAKLADGEGVDRNDALRGTVPVTVTRRLETVFTSGTVNAGGKPAVESLNVPGGIYPDLGSLEVTASSSALAGLQNGIAKLADYPYGCVEQRSSRIRVLLDLGQLSEKYPLPTIRTGTVKKVVQDQINLLRTYQTADGGMAYWPGDEVADQFITPRIYLLLLDAKVAGYKIPAGMLDQLRAYLVGVAQGERGDNFVEDSIPNQAQVAWALARGGTPDSGLADFLYAKRYDLSYLEQVHLLNAMLEAGETGARPNGMFADLLSSVRTDGKRALVQEDFDWTTWPSLSYLEGGESHNTAALLSLLVRVDASHPLVSQLAAGLLAQRRNGAWSNTLESGYALKALLDVSKYAERTTPDFTAKIAVGTSGLLSEKFSTADLSVLGSSTPMAQLRTRTEPGANPLTVSADGKGTLHWSATLRYAPNLASLKPLDQGLTVERAYYPYTKTEYDKSGSLVLPAPTTTFKAGDLVRVVLKVSSPEPRFNIVVDDPLPAGLEALNASLASTSAANVGEGDTGGGDGAPVPAYDRVEIGNDRVVFFASQLADGEHVVSYIARATAPGTFVIAPTQAEDMYRPDVFGRNATATMVVTPPAAASAPTVGAVTSTTRAAGSTPTSTTKK